MARDPDRRPRGGRRRSARPASREPRLTWRGRRAHGTRAGHARRHQKSAQARRTTARVAQSVAPRASAAVGDRIRASARRTTSGGHAGGRRCSARAIVPMQRPRRGTPQRAAALEHRRSRCIGIGRLKGRRDHDRGRRDRRLSRRSISGRRAEATTLAWGVCTLGSVAPGPPRRCRRQRVRDGRSTRVDAPRARPLRELAPPGRAWPREKRRGRWTELRAARARARGARRAGRVGPPRRLAGRGRDRCGRYIERASRDCAFIDAAPPHADPRGGRGDAAACARARLATATLGIGARGRGGRAARAAASRAHDVSGRDRAVLYPAGRRTR